MIFEPKGDRARWRVLYDLLRKLDVGDTISYVECGTALDLDPNTDRHVIQMAMRRAAKEFETEDKHALESVVNVGYRVVEAEKHLVLAKRQQKRAGKALARGHSKVVNVDLSDVEPEVRSAFQVVAQAFSMQMEMNRRFDSRARKLEEAVEMMDAKQGRSESELAELRARIERLEKS